MNEYSGIGVTLHEGLRLHGCPGQRKSVLSGTLGLIGSRERPPKRCR